LYYRSGSLRIIELKNILFFLGNTAASFAIAVRDALTDDQTAVATDSGG
jgi:hypothetical protein